MVSNKARDAATKSPALTRNSSAAQTAQIVLFDVKEVRRATSPVWSIISY